MSGAAASKVIGLLSKDFLERDPMVSEVDERTCVACYSCLQACPYGAITRKEILDRQGKLVKRVAYVNKALCQGCGVCVAACRSKSVDLCGFTDQQMAAALDGLVGSSMEVKA